MILVRTPSPFSTESFLGYVLRVSETNGYDTPSYLFNCIAETMAERQSGIFSVDKLANLVGKPSEVFVKLANKKKKSIDGTEFCILGHSLTSYLSFNPMRLNEPAFCPQCVKETGFLDAFWDLKLAIACPVHQCELITTCHTCGSALNWHRPGLLTCKCGAPLSDSPTIPVSKEVVDLMRILQAKLHGTTPCLLSAGLPVEEISSMSLRSILLKLPHLTCLTKNDATHNPIGHVAQIAGALANWPTGFHALLGQMNVNQAILGTAYRKRYENFYAPLFKGSCSSDVNWLRDEFIRYGLEMAQDSVLDSKILRGESTTRRFITKNELANKLGVSQVTLTHWLQEGKLNLKVLQTKNKQNRYIADTVSLDLCPPLVGKGAVFNYREGAAYIGMPVAVLANLKAKGRLPSQYRIRHKGGYHQDDLNAFKSTLLALSPPIMTKADQDGVSFCKILSHYRFHSADRKADFVVAYLMGEICSTGRADDSLESIVFNRSEVLAYVEQCRKEGSQNSLSQQKTAKLLECDIAAIHGLLMLGHLVEGPFFEGVRITFNSSTSFVERYVPLSNLSHQWGTNAKRLIRIAHEARLDLLAVARKEKTSKVCFIARADVSKLKEWHVQSSKQGTFTGTPTIRRTTAALSGYLASLKETGVLLPMRNLNPNLRAIAQACGFDRNVLYLNKTLQAMLRAYTEEVRQRHSDY